MLSNTDKKTVLYFTLLVKKPFLKWLLTEVIKIFNDLIFILQRQTSLFWGLQPAHIIFFLFIYVIFQYLVALLCH